MEDKDLLTRMILTGGKLNQRQYDIIAKLGKIKEISGFQIDFSDTKLARTDEDAGPDEASVLWACGYVPKEHYSIEGICSLIYNVDPELEKAFHDCELLAGHVDDDPENNLILYLSAGEADVKNSCKPDGVHVKYFVVFEAKKYS